MTGQDHDRASGVQALLTRGLGNLLEGPVGAQRPAAIELLDGADPERSRQHLTVRHEDVEIVIAPEWLADLHDPTLVISHGYVGPDRRRGDRTPPGYGGSDFHAGRAGRFAHTARIVCMTLVLAVPLTLVAARSLPSSSTSTAAPVATTGSYRSTGATAVSRPAPSAPQPAPAPQQVAADTPAWSGIASTFQAADASAAIAQLTQAAAVAQTLRAAKQHAVRAEARAERRAAAQAAAAQAARAQATRAQRRAAAQAAAAQAARAQNQAAHIGGGGHQRVTGAVPLPAAT